MSPELVSQIAIWRQQASEGNLTIDQMRQAVILLRGDRKTAAVSSDQARKQKARKEIKTADEMLKELNL